MSSPRDHWIVGLDDMMPEVSGYSCPSARLHSHGIPARTGSRQWESFHGRWGWFSQIQPRPKQQGQLSFTAAPKHAGLLQTSQEYRAP